MANEDKPYLTWIRSQPCAVCESTVDIQAHHSTVGSTSPLFPLSPSEPLHSLTEARGRGQRAHDHWAIPLCPKHHAELHEFRGYFAGSNEERRAWQDNQVRELRLAFLDVEVF